MCVCVLKDGCDYFQILVFYAKKKQKCSRVTFNYHIGMRVDAFERSNNEETFFILSLGHKIYKKFSRDTQTW